VRQRLIEHLQGLIEGSDGWSARRHDELVGSLCNKPGLQRLVRRTKAGLLRIDHAAAAREAHYDGKWLLRTSDPTLPAEDLAAAYKQLLAVERGWRDCKTSLGLRPVYQHREDHIRAHVQLCWLALLLIRVAETPAPATPGATYATNSTACSWSPSPPPTAASLNAPPSPTGKSAILAALDLPDPPKTSTSPPAPTPPSPTDQPADRYRRGVTRLKSTHLTFALFNAEIQQSVCPLSAEVGPRYGPSETQHSAPYGSTAKPTSPPRSDTSPAIVSAPSNYC